MGTLQGLRAARFELVTAAHHFLLTALPLRHPESLQRLATFADSQIASADLLAVDRDAVLIQVLAAVEPYAGGRLPSLVDRFVGLRDEIPDGLRRFQRCIEDVVRYQGIGHPFVQEAIAIIHDRHSDPGLSQSIIAEAVELSPATLSSVFSVHVGRTCSEYLREVRLDHAGQLLALTKRSVKEVWVSVGYKDGATFCHDFKAHFDVTPGEYRIRGIRRQGASPAYRSIPPIPRSGRVLIVDDNCGTRDTVGSIMTLAGYIVATAEDGRDGLRQASTFGPDVVLLDLHLPDTDGLTWLRKLRAERPGTRPAVILFTADMYVEEFESEIRPLGASILSKLSNGAEVERLVTSLTRWNASSLTVEPPTTLKVPAH